jgi:hypothetical protein
VTGNFDRVFSCIGVRAFHDEEEYSIEKGAVGL